MSEKRTKIDLFSTSLYFEVSILTHYNHTIIFLIRCYGTQIVVLFEKLETEVREVAEIHKAKGSMSAVYGPDSHSFRIDTKLDTCYTVATRRVMILKRMLRHIQGVNTKMSIRLVKKRFFSNERTTGIYITNGIACAGSDAWHFIFLYVRHINRMPRRLLAGC